MNIYNLIAEMLGQGRFVILARIVNLKGSAPRSTGASCILTDEGKLFGTVGGGSLEHEVLRRARQIMKTKKSCLFEFTMLGEDVSDSQMLCGGKAMVYIEPLTPDNRETVEVYSNLSRMRHNGIAGSLVTLVKSGTDAVAAGQRLLISQSGEKYGKLDIPTHYVGIPGGGNPRLMETNGANGVGLFVEPFGQTDKVIIFGAGHISTCLAPLLKPLGFSTSVVDDRHEYANETRFPDADHVHAVPFKEAFKLLSVDSSTYIVIVTRGHAHDKEVLSESLRKPAAYIGMIGSRKKRETIYRALLSEGFLTTRLEDVYSPIGIDILSETPEEIAVSIAAELIRVRAERRAAVKKGK